MAEIKRVYRQSMPAVKLAGRCYGEEDKTNGTFADKWNEWFEQNLFEPLGLSAGDEWSLEDRDAVIGLCRCKDGEPLQYWIGVFMPPDAAVPDGYDSIMVDKGDIAVCWVYGTEPDIYSHCCINRLEEEGFEWTGDKDGVRWCFERYSCPRFTTPDDKGNIILDMCFYVK